MDRQKTPALLLALFTYIPLNSCAPSIRSAIPKTSVFIPSGNMLFTTYPGTTQSFTVPSGVTQILVKAWGGGGGGGTSTGGANVGGSGGGGGFVEGPITTTPGETLTIQVGAGGSGAFSSAGGQGASGGGGAGGVGGGASNFSGGGSGGGGSSFGPTGSIFISGNGQNAANTSDSSYTISAGAGGSSQTSGNQGLVVFTWGFLALSISPSTGPTSGGALETITGLNFQSGTTVAIGGKSCTQVSIISSTQLTCVAPSGSSGSADVVLSVGSYSYTIVGGYSYGTSLVLNTPGIQNFIVPSFVSSITVKAWGAGGGGGDTNNSNLGGTGGGGAFANGVVATTPGETLIVQVGISGQSPTGAYGSQGGNGAGAGGIPANGDGRGGGSGGAASFVERSSAILITAAGGGGGSGASSSGAGAAAGAGGAALTADSGTAGTGASPGNGGGGASQIAGGAAGSSGAGSPAVAT